MCSSPLRHFLCLRIFSFIILVKTPRTSFRITRPTMLGSFEGKVLNLTACGWEQRPPEIWSLSNFWSTANVTYGSHISVILHTVKPSPPVWSLCETPPPQKHEITEKQAGLPQQGFFFKCYKYGKYLQYLRFSMSISFLLWDKVASHATSWTKPPFHWF